MAKKALGRVANGEDPQANKLDRRGKDRHTLKATVADYLAIKQREVRPRTYTEQARYLTGPYFKPLHSLALDQITRKDVATRLNRISLESSSIVAGRARAHAVRAVYVWAMQAGLVRGQPGDRHRQAEGKPAARARAVGRRAGRIWKACGDDDHGRCIKLLILTGCRRQEIGGMCWSEFNFEQGTWTLPASRSKNGRAHTLPLLPAMLAIIKAVPRMAGRDQLFGAARQRLHRHGRAARRRSISARV